MNIKRYLAFLWVTVLVVAVAGCSKPEAGSKADSDVDYYTCTMHPSVRSKDPKAKCPICSMDLVPVMNKDAAGAPVASSPMTSQFSVPVERQQMIGVTYAIVEQRPLQTTLRTVGLLEPDAQKLFEYVSRVDGYVEKLQVSSPGQMVKQGEPLMTIYSPDLLATEQELLELLSSTSSSSSRFVESAKQRLKLWNVSDEDIAELLKTRKATEFLTLRSPFAGIVRNVSAKPGMSVKTGDPLVSLVDLSTIWMWAEFYENELPLLSIGQKINVAVPNFGKGTFDGRIAAIEPFLDPMKRTVRVRIDVANPEWNLRPGMFVNAWLDVQAGEGLTVPVSAVLPTGTRNIVFLDKGEGRLELRYIDLGRKFAQAGRRSDNDYYEIRDGLVEGDRVVASANFLIDAESKIQGAQKTWEAPEPASAVESPGMMPEVKPGAIPLPNQATALYEPLLNAYFAMQRTLASDKMEGLASSADAFLAQLERIASAEMNPAKDAAVYRASLKTLEASAEKFRPANLEDARIQFGQLSADLISLLTQFPPALENSLYFASCPMWEKSPSRWVQATKDIENPFMGAAMPGCGEIAGGLKAAK